MNRTRRIVSRIAIVVVPSLVACGGDAGTSNTDAGVDATGTEASADVSSCTPGGACSDNPNAGCSTGTISCDTGSPKCVDATAARDGTVCKVGLCAHGRCLGPTTVSADHDLSAKTLTQGRTCADSPSYSVTAFGPSKATLATAPTGDCLVAGDEVLLIDLQGAVGATVNVGNWELLDVKAVAGTEVTFTTAKKKSYGATAASDASIGVGAGQQKVALIRVPAFGALSIAGGAKVTSNAWAGALGGVVPIRAASLAIDGTITAAGLGYRDGRWSRDSEACYSSVQTEAGESIDGPPFAGTANHFGGPGGVGPGNGGFNTNSPISSGAGHSGPGEVGVNSGVRTIGVPGVAYGAKDASLLTMGSGGGGNLTCATSFPGPQLVDNGEHLAGGIILLLVDKLDVTGSASITASAASAYRDASGSGGYVFIRGTTLNLGTNRVTAAGGVGTPVNGPVFGTKIASSDGYVVVQATTVSGTTLPAANKL